MDILCAAVPVKGFGGLLWHGVSCVSSVRCVLASYIVLCGWDFRAVHHACCHGLDGLGFDIGCRMLRFMAHPAVDLCFKQDSWQTDGCTDTDGHTQLLPTCC